MITNKENILFNLPLIYGRLGWLHHTMVISGDYMVGQREKSCMKLVCKSCGSVAFPGWWKKELKEKGLDSYKELECPVCREKSWKEKK